MPKKKAEKNSNNNSNLQLELQKLNNSYYLISSFFKTLRCFFICASFVGCAYFLGGKTTITNLSAIVSTSTEKVSSVYIYVIVVLFFISIAAIIWACIERRIRIKIKLSKRDEEFKKNG
ncbi:hypothetical protein BGI05_03165 [Snodgrassella alvi]|uniref:hypothetical protein n=1 Tax=Snodgrassella alvi TaxID=1196083 RepID=UPI000A070994|nr:hypothetical protein [Snodgrassella alvi]ORF04470.1 hypothetical protein BGH97_00675 [Snodgrassella alvi]ORF09652.1 hypothetical protein BGH99_01520 [Snodgrassella alvi]ORF10041.1 hypothetical protein BGI00_10725 [Snodgrassella alvi]ORF11306.1 hypothetical protein BGI02_10680 [Snodgrassella alvi]ORF21976.1 hypothetical protein BGI05_03165 [Snodgrassella alvi]